jgi:hypothetical protein
MGQGVMSTRRRALLLGGAASIAVTWVGSSQAQTQVNTVLNVANSQREADARVAFGRLRNPADARFLDDFIAAFRGTAFANIAFTVRYELLRASSSIATYDRFIDIYSGTVPALLALEELYTLYRLADEGQMYLEFIRKYPSSALSADARMRAEHHFLRAALTISADENLPVNGRIAMLDDFVLTFPQSNLLPIAEAFAAEIALRNERSGGEARDRRIRDEIQRNIRGADPANLENLVRSEIRDQRARAARVAKRRLEDLASLIPPNPSVNTTAGAHVVAAGVRTISPELVLARIQYERASRILLEVYPDEDAADAVRDEQRHREIIGELRAIKDLLRTQHAELIAVIREEMQRTREVIAQGFRRAAEQIQTVTDSVQQVNATLGIVAESVGEISRTSAAALKELGQQGRSLQQMQELMVAGIDQTARLADVLHDDLRLVNDSIRQVNSSVVVGFAAQQDELVRTRTAVVSGLGVIREGQELQLDEMRRTRTELSGRLSELTDVTSVGFRQTRERLDASIRQEAQFHYQSMLQDRQLNSRLIGNMARFSRDQIQSQRQGNREVAFQRLSRLSFRAVRAQVNPVDRYSTC